MKQKVNHIMNRVNYNKTMKFNLTYNLLIFLF